MYTQLCAHARITTPYPFRSVYNVVDGRRSSAIGMRGFLFINAATFAVNLVS